MTSDNDKKAADEYVRNNVAEHDGSYWGWNSDDIALAEAAFLAGCEHKQKEIDELKKFEILEPHTCEVCKKQYGRTNLLWRENTGIWVACDCHPKDKAYFLNTTNLAVRSVEMTNPEETKEREVYYGKPRRFDYKVLEFFDSHHIHDSLFWSCEDNKIKWWVICNDVFLWGCSDGEDITEENFSGLEKAYQDCRDIIPEGEFLFSGDWLMLWVARCRKERPQGAAYPDDERLWVLFDAAGPFRETGLGNPYKNRTEYKAAKAKMAEQLKQKDGAG